MHEQDRCRDEQRRTRRLVARDRDEPRERQSEPADVVRGTQNRWCRTRPSRGGCRLGLRLAAWASGWCGSRVSSSTARAGIQPVGTPPARRAPLPRERCAPARARVPCESRSPRRRADQGRRRARLRRGWRLGGGSTWSSTSSPLASFTLCVDWVGGGASGSGSGAPPAPSAEPVDVSAARTTHALRAARVCRCRRDDVLGAIRLSLPPARYAALLVRSMHAAERVVAGVPATTRTRVITCGCASSSSSLLAARGSSPRRADRSTIPVRRPAGTAGRSPPAAGRGVAGSRSC